jgi:hypothetical protein
MIQTSKKFQAKSLSADHDKRTLLTPATVLRALSEYQRFIENWSQWLDERGIPRPKLMGPVGSVAYAHSDFEDGRDVTYGDIDVLLELPVADKLDHFAKNSLQRQYRQHLIDYLQNEQPANVHVDATLGRGEFECKRPTPFMILLKLDCDTYVLADTIITFSDISSWTKARYTPMRGYKGYIHGNFYDTLSEILNISLSKNGITAKFQNGQLVPTRKRKDVTARTVSTDPQNFFMDVLFFLAGSHACCNSLLRANPGINPDVHADELLKMLASGAKGLLLALEANGVINDAFGKINFLNAQYRAKNDKEAAKRGVKEPVVAAQFIKMSDDASEVVNNILCP